MNAPEEKIPDKVVVSSPEIIKDVNDCRFIRHQHMHHFRYINSISLNKMWCVCFRNF